MSGGGGSGGGGGPLARLVAMGEQAPAPSGAAYTPANTSPTYQPAFSSQQGGIGGLPMATPQPAPQQMQQSGMSPLLQQQMAQQQQQFRPQQQFQQQGIQQLLNSMMNRFQPQMQQRQMPMQVPQFRSPALSYRPNMANAQQALTRVKPSVYKTDLDTARARIAELEASQQPQDPYYGGGG